MAIKNQEIGAKTKKPKDKPVPAVCVCGELPVDVKSRGLGVCYFCKKCSVRGNWNRSKDAAIVSWNAEVTASRHRKSAWRSNV